MVKTFSFLQFIKYLNLSCIWKHNLSGSVTQLRPHLSQFILQIFIVFWKKKKRLKCFLYFTSLFYLRVSNLIVALDLQEVSKHYNFISQIPTSSVEVRGQRLYRWMVIFQCGCDREFMKAIKIYRRCNRVPPESHCLLYLPCRSGFV